MVFQKGNPLRRCVNKALDRLWRNGTIKKLQQRVPRAARRARPEVAPLDGNRSSRILGGATARGSSESRAVAIALLSTIVFIARDRRRRHALARLGRVQGVLPRRDVLPRLVPRDRDAPSSSTSGSSWSSRRSCSSRRSFSRSCAACPGPVFFPIRALAVVYVDFFRGVPTILVILMLGSGHPRAPALVAADRPDLLGERRARARLHGLRLRGLPRGDRVGAPEPGGSRALARPDAHARRSATSSSPRPCGA